MTATSAPVLAYRAKDALEARALAARLAADGIEAHVLGEFLQGAYAGVNAGGMNTPEVWIGAGDLPRAESIIAAWRERFAVHPPPDRAGTEVRGNTNAPSSQFSTAALLGLMTLVAIFAAAAAFGLVTHENWPVWIFALFVIALVLQVLLRSTRKVNRAAPWRHDAREKIQNRSGDDAVRDRRIR